MFRWNTATDTAIRTTGQAVISSGISTAIGGGSFGSNFNAALLGEAGNVAMATGFNWVGDTIKFPDGGPQKIVAHAIMGGLLAELTGSDFKTGAVAAGLNEALIPGMAKVAGENKNLQLMLSQLTGLLAAAAVDGDLNTGSTIAKKATEFNYLFHAELVEREQKLNTCASPADCQSVRDYYNNLDATRNSEFGQYCQRNPASCAQVTKQLVDEIPANEQLLQDVRVSGDKDSFARSISLWLSNQSNSQAINTSIVEKSRVESGDGEAFLAELALDALDALDALNPDRDLFSSTAGGKGGTTGVKVGVVGRDGAKDGGTSGFSGGKPTAVDDPYSPSVVTERSKVNREDYGRENTANEFPAGLPNYATHSTAKSYQSTVPRDLNEQTLWNRVIDNPSAGRDTKLAGDKDFPRSEGWRKMEVSHRLPSGENITVHYQHNSVTDKAYDMKITTPQQLPPALQPGRTIE
ncbi:DUF637 domain-containing protein [Pseudomonas brassicacearum]|uniref:DUF637 domain-containing protein n=1 Tax=Pseudomonas brassicacearum TaxID=930166 RepID=UPI0024B93C86|nr:DUF637 domain-containing protein [Pseudomonas brassicacearum]WHS57092.1 DUF637 domain-containing protein [Pseudomonas brassicacearum]